MQIHGIPSKTLGMEIGLNVLVPQYSATEGRCVKTPGPYPVLYLLHGYKENGLAWMRMTRIEYLLRNKPVVVVMPDTHDNWWVNTKTEWNYFDFLTGELPQMIGDWLPVSQRREDAMIAGFSMGGYGALNAALNRPDLYGHAAAFAPVCDLSDFYRRDVPMRAEWVFGSREEYLAGPQHPANAAAALAASDSPRTPIYMACGTNDSLYNGCLAFRDCALGLGLPLSWNPMEGHKHDWFFAEEALVKSLAWAGIAKEAV